MTTLKELKEIERRTGRKLSKYVEELLEGSEDENVLNDIPFDWYFADGLYEYVMEGGLE